MGWLGCCCGAAELWRLIRNLWLRGCRPILLVHCVLLWSCIPVLLLHCVLLLNHSETASNSAAVQQTCRRARHQQQLGKRCPESARQCVLVIEGSSAAASGHSLRSNIPSPSRTACQCALDFDSRATCCAKGTADPGKVTPLESGAIFREKLLHRHRLNLQPASHSRCYP